MARIYPQVTRTRDWTSGNGMRSSSHRASAPAALGDAQPRASRGRSPTPPDLPPKGGPRCRGRSSSLRRDLGRGADEAAEAGNDVERVLACAPVDVRLEPVPAQVPRAAPGAD